jgi:transcriptional regulator with XRE-family HTH domain
VATPPITGAKSNDQLSFGDALRRYRIAAGLTQEGLAERAALSPRGISDLERAARIRPHAATVHRLAEALGLSDADRRVLQAAAHAPTQSRSATESRTAAHDRVMPTPLSSFVGREHELAEVRQLITAYRLVTLLGPGGIGKTRLAVEVATGLVDDFADGVVFVPFASVRHPDLVVGAIAQALGIQEMGSRALFERLRAISMFDDFYRDVIGLDSVFDAYRLLQGFPNKTVESGLALWQLSRQALGVASVRKVLQDTLDLTSEGRVFLGRLREYLETWGQRGDRWGWSFPAD